MNRDVDPTSLVARRELQMDGREVVLLVGQARPFADDETDVYCPYRLEQLDGTEIWSSVAGGVDSAQAVLLALTAAGDRLAQHDGEVTFLGGRELSLPVTTRMSGHRTVAELAHGPQVPGDPATLSTSLPG